MSPEKKSRFGTITVAVTSAGVMLVAQIVFTSWQRKEAKIDNGATIEYVDKRDSEIKEILKNKADSKDVINVLEMVKDNNQKLNFLYEEAIKSKRK